MLGINQQLVEESLLLIEQGIEEDDPSLFFNAGMKMVAVIGFFQAHDFTDAVKTISMHFRQEIGLFSSSLKDDQIAPRDIREEFINGAIAMHAVYAESEKLRETLQTSNHIIEAIGYLSGAVNEGMRGVRERRQNSSSEVEY